jgi:hypothetical protein
MISFYIDNYKLGKIRTAAHEHKLRFSESNGRGADGKRVYGFYELSDISPDYYRNVSKSWSIDEAYAVLKTRGDFSHIKKEGEHRGDYSPSFNNENNIKSSSRNQLQDTNSKKPWVTLENGKKHYTRASAIDIVIALIVPAIGPILGVISLMKKEYKRGWTMVGIGLVQIIWIMIKTGG